MAHQPATRSSKKFAEKWQNAFGSGEAESAARLPTALLFTGPVGSGKREAAETVARSLLGSFEKTPDFIHLQPEKNTIKIEVIRHLIQRLSLKPFEKGRIVIWIEDADAMTEGAANALLKTLEEPPDYVLFILTATRPERLPMTVRSRCQRVLFQVETEALRGRLRNLMEEWKEELGPLLNGRSKGFTAASHLADSVSAQRERLPSLFDLLRAYWRDLASWATLGENAPLLFTEHRGNIARTAGKKSPAALFEEMDLILETERAVEGNVNKMLALERMFSRLLS